MADADEDVIPSSGPSAEETDLSDETQDFRFLATLSSEDAKIPKRGEKDFEPHATALQSNILAASRQAMHNALSFQRMHQPKGYTMATYHPESNMAYAYNPKGPLFAKMGQVLPPKEDPLGDDERRGQRLWLLPEEVLYCLERGTLDVRWPANEDTAEGEHGLPMSLQGAYAMFIGDQESHGGALTFERYSVYSALKRMGYTVHRAPSWNSPGPPPDTACQPPAPQRSWQLGFLNSGVLWRYFSSKQPQDRSQEQKLGPMVSPGLYRSYADIYRRLALIDYHDPTSQLQTSQPSSPLDDSTFRITYHVYKPGSTTYKKSARGPPDFRISVVDARETAVPTLEQLSGLLEATPFNPPRADAQLYAKLKNGYKNVILAVVDQGITSYLRIADAGFSKERLYERTGRPSANKRGGGSGGRGRGRAR